MQIVEPIREKKQVEAIKKLLLADGKVRDLLLFELGINSALRITDLLSLKVGDVFDNKGKPVQKFIIKESKTQKTNEITIVDNVKETLLKYKQAYPDIVAHSDYYVFFQEKDSSKKEGISEIKKGQIAIKRRMAEYLITKRCDSIGLQGNYGTHTLRKTRGYFAYTSKYSMELIQKKLNHSSPGTTLRYIGITAENISNMYIEMNL